MNVDSKRKLLALLLDIKHNEGINLKEGICNQVNREGVSVCDIWIGAFDEFICNWFPRELEDWEYFSGSVVFPIKGDDEDPMISYTRSYDEGSMWIGEYGRRRLELLDMMIKYVEDSMEEEEIV